MIGLTGINAANIRQVAVPDKKVPAHFAQPRRLHPRGKLGEPIGIQRRITPADKVEIAL